MVVAFGVACLASVFLLPLALVIFRARAERLLARFDGKPYETPEDYRYTRWAARRLAERWDGTPIPPLTDAIGSHTVVPDGPGWRIALALGQEVEWPDSTGERRLLSIMETRHYTEAELIQMADKEAQGGDRESV